MSHEAFDDPEEDREAEGKGRQGRLALIERDCEAAGPQCDEPVAAAKDQIVVLVERILDEPHLKFEDSKALI